LRYDLHREAPSSRIGLPNLAWFKDFPVLLSKASSNPSIRVDRGGD
jgi:hypothetical protein